MLHRCFPLPSSFPLFGNSQGPHTCCLGQSPSLSSGTALSEVSIPALDGSQPRASANHPCSSWAQREGLEWKMRSSRDQDMPQHCMFDVFFPCIKSNGQELSTRLLRRDLSGPNMWCPSKILEYTPTHQGPYILKPHQSGSSCPTKPAFQLFCATKVQPHVESLLASKGLRASCVLSLHGSTNGPFFLPGQLLAHVFSGVSKLRKSVGLAQPELS